MAISIKSLNNGVVGSSLGDILPSVASGKTVLVKKGA